jgi:hypothetical protein
VISAFGVDHPDVVSKKGPKSLKPFKRMWKKAKFGNAGTMFGSREHTPKFKAPKKPEWTSPDGKTTYPERPAHKPKWGKGGKEMPSAFEVGMHRGWREGYGPIRSAATGLGYAAAHSPGTAAAAGTGAVGALGGGAYLAGRSRKKSEG